MRTTPPLHFENFNIQTEEGDTLSGLLRRVADQVDQLQARPRGVVTDIKVDMLSVVPVEASALVRFRLESEEETTAILETE